MCHSFSRPSRRALLAAPFALLPLCGFFYFAQAQTSEAERAAVSRALESRGDEMRRGDASRGRKDGVFGSPDGNFVVIDLGDSERYGSKARSHAVYDFAAKKVFVVTFTLSNTGVHVESQNLR